jgi:hypothetical protein
MVQVTNVTFQEVLDVAEGGACPLRVMLSKAAPADPALKKQYYFTRSIYCRAKFMEKYGGKPFPADLETNIPASIVDYWSKCDAALQQIITKTGLQFFATGLIVKAPDFDDQISVDATGRTRDKEFVVFKLIWGSQLRKHYKIQLVKQLDFLHDADATMYLGGRPVDEVSVAALMVGKDDGDDGQIDVAKAVRFIDPSDALDSKGKVKEKGWAGLRVEFDAALAEARRIVTAATGNPVHLITTNPGPMTCGSCPYHNKEVTPRKVCTGYVHPSA